VTSRQFACLDCKQYINAGYRWCYTYLERPGIVTAGELLDVDKVLARAEYWAIPAAGQTTTAWLDSLPPHVSGFLQASPLVQTSTAWLEKLLPEVHAFLLFHRKHKLKFGEAANEHFYSAGTDFLEWDDVEAGEPLDVSIQSLCTKGCREWADIEAYMNSRQLPVWWWGQPEIMEAAQRRFAAFVNQLEPRRPGPSA
jgi:hypothetical protein